nr:hypothetical protein [Tanacetum cinerariifolium]
MRYVDTSPNRELLKKTIYEGPYVMTKITHSKTPKDGGRPRVLGYTKKETYAYTDLVNIKLIDAEAVHMILNRIGNDIYSTMDACPNAKEMWIAIKCLQLDESINIQEVKPKMLKEFDKFTSMDRESIESYYTRCYIMMNEMVRNKLKVDNMQGFGHLAKECQKPKWVKDYEYHKEKMMLCKQEGKGVPLSAKQNEWLQDTDEEPHEQELETHYMYMVKIQEVLHATNDNSLPTYYVEPLEKVHTNDDYNVVATE